MPNTATTAPEAYLPRFGLNSFRAGQKEVISTVLARQDCLCVMPTGGGKSLCYQLPALALDGLTLVVSPLIALMKDQVDQLQTLGLPVSFINSTLPTAEQYARLDRMAAGEFHLVYVSPERFRSGRFLDAVRAITIKLLAVDEAHCISEWGHDFRPDYARLGYFRRLLGNPATIALTATATDRVRRDIIEQLDLRDPKIFIAGFARPNLFYEVQSPRTERQKPEALVRFLKQTPGSGIIYTSTRKKAEEVAAIVADETRRKTVVYHAGLLPDQRRKAQDDFMHGRREIVVATNAFGMGIDKADVRFVVHYNIPGSIEAYYQEAGRAGRDGAPSRCLMIYHASDRYIQEYFINSAYPDREHVEAVYEYLCDLDENPIEMTQDEIKQAIGLPIGTDGVGNCEQLLEGAGVLERLIASQNLASVRIDSDVPTLVDFLPKQARTQRKVLQAVEQIVGPRRQEIVQFNLRDLTVNDELDQTSIAGALRELNRLESFTYVPPFRGRAIRMIRRDQPFDKLEIDFEAIERRKAAELEKLERVITFARSESCRQREILRYFGEENAGRCGHCDNCRLRAARGEGRGEKGEGRKSKNRPRETPPDCGPGVAGENEGVESPLAAGPHPNPLRAPTEGWSGEGTVDGKVLEAVRMVLAGVARIQKRQFSCGRNLIAQMLCGSGSAKIKKLGLHKLSTYGLLKHLKQEEVILMIDALMALRCLQQTEVDRFRPVIELTEFGGEVMRGRESLPGELPLPAELLRKLQGGERGTGNVKPEFVVQASRLRDSEQPADANAGETPAPQGNEPDPDVLSALKQWRGKIADEAGVPRYCILSNDALAELVGRRPATREQLLAVKGIGPAKAERYGAALLKIVGGAEEKVESGERRVEREADGPNEQEAGGSSQIEELFEQAAVESASAEEPEEPRWWTASGKQSASKPAGLPNKPVVLPDKDADAAVDRPRPPIDPSSPISHPSHYWTRRLLSAGFTVDECAAIRGLSREIILEHARLAAGETDSVP